MQAEGFFQQSLVYLSAAIVSVIIAKRLGLGSVLGYLMAGILIGPHGLQFIGHEGKDVMHFAEFGVVMMLFLIGLELQPSLLWKLRKPILGMGGFQVIVTSLIIASIAVAVGIHFKSALAIGMILSLSSTAIVLQTLHEKGLIKTDGGQSSFSVLLFQDIAVIPMLAILPLLAIKEIPYETSSMHTSNTWIEALPGWSYALVVLGLILIIIFMGRFVMSHIFRIVAKTRLREIFTATSLFLVIGIAYLMTKVGVSPALGTFLAGVVLANCEYRHEIESDIEPFKGLLLALFFISVGASINFNLIYENPELIWAIVMGLIIVKFLILFILGRVFKMGIDQNMLFAFALAQGGEFAFVLFSFSIQNNVISTDVANLLIASVAISMAMTPLLMLINEKFVIPHIGTKEKEEKKTDLISEENPVIIAGFGSFGSIIGRLLKAKGIGITVLELDSDKVDLLRKLGLKTFYGDASRHDLLYSAGADKAKILILAINDHEKMLKIVKDVKKHFPHLIIFARASDRTAAYELLDLGVKYVYRDTLDTSLRMGVDVLRNLGFRAYQAHRAAKIFRQYDDESIHILKGIRHDRKTYISSAKKRIEDLEELMLSELKGIEEHEDAGWDTEAMREEFGRLKE